MRVHSDILSYGSFFNAAQYAGVVVDPFNVVGSRSRAKVFDFSLLGTSSYQRGFGMGGQAATWDEWGIFLNYLFEYDPNMHCGKRSYQNAEHFHWLTGDRFKTLKPEDQCKRHKWGLGSPNCTGAYSVSTCIKCGALRRWLLTYKSWWEFKDANETGASKATSQMG